MGVCEEDVKLEELIQDDFKLATDIAERIVKKYGKSLITSPEILFTLCLIYVRMLKQKGV